MRNFSIWSVLILFLLGLIGCGVTQGEHETSKKECIEKVRQLEKKITVLKEDLVHLQKQYNAKTNEIDIPPKKIDVPEFDGAGTATNQVQRKEEQIIK